jgi:hypothetical protein
MQWRRIKAADYSKFNLVIDNCYKDMPKDAFVYNYQGEQLFFFTYHPNEIPIYTQTGILDIDLQPIPTPYAVKWISSNHMFYNCKGVDSDGVPTFSHFTANHAVDYKDVTQFEPLTVETVVKWLGWFLYQLDNSYLKIGK